MLIIYISGDKYCVDFATIAEAITKSGFKVTRIVSNGETGTPQLAKIYGEANSIPVDVIKADWKDITAKGAVVKEGKWGKYNSRAAMDRDDKIVLKSECYIGVQLTEDDSAVKFDKFKFEKAGKKVFIFNPSEKKTSKKKKYEF